MSADILFVKTSSLGDVIHHMPALTEARLRLPHARFSWVVEEPFAPLVRLHPGVDEIIPVASRRWRRVLAYPSTWLEIARFRHGLRSHAYDEVVDTQGLVRSALIAWMARGRRHGYDADSVRERAAARFYEVHHTVARDLHAVERNRILSGLALGYAPQGRPDFGLDRARLAAPPSRPYALLLHATARPSKEWPRDRWIALGRMLSDRGLRIVLPWGTEAERLQASTIAGALPDADVPARESLDKVARIIASATLVVGVDTGLLHLAAALGVPLVSVFVGTEPTLTGPVGAGRIAVVGGRGVVPSVDEVTAAVETVL